MTGRSDDRTPSDSPGTSAMARAHHEIPVHEVVLLLGSDLVHGLTQQEADDRLARIGPNELPPLRGPGRLVRFARQLHNPLIYVLLAAVAVTLAVGEYVDAAVIAGVVLVNAVVGYVQEERAGRALDALADYARTQATTVRDGTSHRVDSNVLVPGDIVLLEAGDKVPADLRLLDVHDLQVDESALTGESDPVEKDAAWIAHDAALGDRRNMAYSGTLVTAGRGRGLVVETGAGTEIGRIHQLVGTAVTVQTPLTRRLATFGRWLTAVIVALAAVVFAVGVARGESAAQMVTAAVALAVAAIPEGLPAAVTIVLAIGVSRMARRRAVIRRLPAAETLGSTTVICTDKTGTLTQNRMTVQTAYVGGAELRLGDGQPGLARCLVAGALCSDARLTDGPDGATAVGDPTEAALVDAAAGQGLDQRDLLRRWPRLDEIPFSSETGWMGTLHEGGPAGRGVVLVKGAVEAVLPMCDVEIGPDGQERPIDHEAIERQAADFGGRALRVLAFAQADAQGARVLPDGPLSRMAFLGLLAMADPLRPESAAAVRACQAAGIRVKMITGDHPQTARAVAAQAGLGDPGGRAPAVVTGAWLRTAGASAIDDAIEATDVFARVSADQKLAIVTALQGRGHVVAMTGDGINDAPALKRADIGIAMGAGGTEVAKEASDMVLADDNFATIEAAVEEGRGIYANLVKFVAWTLPTNLGEGMVVLVAIALGVTLPMTPVQILWVNMTTAVALGLTLAFEPGEPDIMRRRPRDPAEPLLTAVLVRRIILVAVLLLAGAFGTFEVVSSAGATTEQARTAAVNAFVVMEVAYLLNCRSLSGSVFSVGLLSNRVLLLGVTATAVLQGLFTYAPFMQVAFETQAPPLSAWALAVGLGLAVLCVVGVAKAISARMRRPEPAGTPGPAGAPSVRTSRGMAS